MAETLKFAVDIDKSQLDSLAKSTQSAGTKAADSFTKAYEKADAAFQKLIDKQEKLQSLGVSEDSMQWKSLQYDIEKAGETLRQMDAQKAEMDMAGLGANAAQAAEATEELASASEKASTSESFLSKATERLKGIFKSLAGFIGKAATGFGLLHRSHGRSLSGMVRSMFIYRTITRLLGKLRESIGNVIMADSGMSSSLASIKGSLLAAFAPIANFVIPILQRLLALIQAVASAFAAFMGGLFGIAPAAQKNSAALLAQAGATKEAGGAAGGAAKTIAAFDEINQMSDGGGGGGGGGGGVGWNFDDIENTPIGQFAQKLRDAIAAQNWRAVGTMLAEKVNEAINMIPWAKLGQKIGWGLNALIQSMYWFLKTLDVKAIGEGIATFLNNAIEQIDWYYLGLLLITAITKAFDLLIGFLTTLDWGAVATAISDTLIGFFDGLTEWFESQNWEQLGETFFQKVKDALTHIKWGQVAQSAIKALWAALKAATFFHWGLLKAIGEAIWNYITQGITEEDDPLDMAIKIAKNILEAVYYLSGAGLMHDAIKQIVDSLFGDEFFKQSGDKIKEFFVNLLKGITLSPFNPASWDLFTSSANAEEAYDEGSNLGEQYGAGFKDSSASAFSEAEKAISDAEAALAAMKTSAEETGTSIETTGEQVGTIATEVENVGTAAETATDTIKKRFTGAASTTKAKMASMASSAKTSFNSISGGVISTLGALVSAYLGNVSAAVGATIQQINLLAQAAGQVHLDTSGLTDPKNIPPLAKGGVIPPNHRFLAMLGDQTSGTNVEAPLETIVDAMRIALNSAGGGNNAGAIRQALAGMAIKVDGKTLGYVVADNINKNRRAEGKLALNL